MNDPYVLQNGTLKNKLGIEEYAELNKAEADIGFVKLINVHSVSSDKTDIELIKRIHEHIFEDIFDWAGKFRTIPLFKAERYVIPGLSLDYAKPENIQKELQENVHALNAMRWNEKNIEEKSLEFARHLALIWKVHPFRDGNTRTILSFASIYAREHGFPMDMNVFIDNLSRKKTKSGKMTYSVRDLFVFAALEPEDYPEPEYLAKLIKRAIESEKAKSATIEK